MNETFYSELHIYPFDTAHIFQDTESFTHVPEDWYVLCTDVESSTQFYIDGRWQVVSKLAVAGIDMILRVANKHGIEIPYVYGGDGILACFPSTLLKDISYEAGPLYHYGHAVCGANLRIGIVPVKDIKRAGFDLRIKRVGNIGTVSHTLFDDSAFNWIDHAIKHNTEYALSSLLGELDTTHPNYDEYVLPVWQKVKTAYEGEEYLCLIVATTDKVVDRLAFYDALLKKLYEYAPYYFDQHPIISMEKDDVFSLDFIKTDGSMKVIISAQKPNINSILDYINKLEQEGFILYGHIVSNSSVITYVIKESENYMAGLLDIENGGYVAAAQELKAKMRNSQE